MKALIYILFIIIIGITIADWRFPRKHPAGKPLTLQQKFRHYRLLILIVLCGIAV